MTPDVLSGIAIGLALGIATAALVLGANYLARRVGTLGTSIPPAERDRWYQEARRP